MRDLKNVSLSFLFLSLPHSFSGVAADAKVGSDLIKLDAIDNDIGNNSLVLYHILSIRYIKLQSNDTEDIGNVFIIGESASLWIKDTSCLLFYFIRLWTRCS